MPVLITDHSIPDREALVRLYDSVNWTSYTADPERLHQAVTRSLRVVCAHDGDRLVGLARAVGDGLTIIYLQDILVDPEYQRQGLGRALMNAVFQPYSEVRQQVLITDDEPQQRAFYEHMGYTEIRDLTAHPLRAFVRLAPPLNRDSSSSEDLGAAR